MIISIFILQIYITTTTTTTATTATTTTNDNNHNNDNNINSDTMRSTGRASAALCRPAPGGVLEAPPPCTPRVAIMDYAIR